jgi:hypothetical protein
MHTKLTLRLREELIAEAKRHAEKRGQSVSQMVTDYFQLLGRRLGLAGEELPLTPVVSKLKGSLRKPKVGVKDYRRYLEEKFR